MPHDHALRLDLVCHHNVVIASEAHETKDGLGAAHPNQTSCSTPHCAIPALRLVSIVHRGEQHLNVALGIHPVVVEKNVRQRPPVRQIARQLDLQQAVTIALFRPALRNDVHILR